MEVDDHEIPAAWNQRTGALGAQAAQLRTVLREWSSSPRMWNTCARISVQVLTSPTRSFLLQGEGAGPVVDRILDQPFPFWVPPALLVACTRSTLGPTLPACFVALPGSSSPARRLVTVILGRATRRSRGFGCWFFNIQNHIGDMLTSNSGTPEGCSLSVVSMTILDWRRRWRRGFSCVGACSLMLRRHTFGPHPADRRQSRTCARRGIGSQRDRLNALEPLRHSWGTSRLKVTILIQSFWAKVGIALMPWQHIGQLRTKAAWASGTLECIRASGWHSSRARSSQTQAPISSSVSFRT